MVVYWGIMVVYWGVMVVYWGVWFSLLGGYGIQVHINNKAQGLELDIRTGEEPV